MDGSRPFTLLHLQSMFVSILLLWSNIPSRLSYQDEQFDSWGVLRVLNEDRVQPFTGFGTHGHREFEIFSYVVDGALEQLAAVFSVVQIVLTPVLSFSKDSMGNTEILKRGDIQMTSAGTGIRHSEKAHGDKQGNRTRLLKSWKI